MTDNLNHSAISGSVFGDIDNAASFASQQLKSLSYIRRCSIAVANATDFTLVNPRRHLSSGRIVSLPLEIPPGHTGLVGAYKTIALASGTAGVITYEIQGLNSPARYFQLMWSVPYIGTNWVNVWAGDEPANDKLFSRMYEGATGRVCRAEDTSTNDLVCDGRIRVDTVMGATGHAVLVARLSMVTSTTLPSKSRNLVPVGFAADSR